MHDLLLPKENELDLRPEPLVVKQKMRKFDDPFTTADGSTRGFIDPVALNTVWFNTGTLCNIECLNCYIESSPKNNRLVYMTADEVVVFLEEIKKEYLGTQEIGLTGGEPFMNREIIAIMEACLARGFNLIVLTNAMRPMMRFKDDLLALNKKYGSRCTLRVSVDHFDPAKHEEERGKGSWKPMLEGLKWLSDNGFTIDIAGRTRWDENESDLRLGFKAFFAEHNINIDAASSKQLVLFPEMAKRDSVPEITTACWDILGVRPEDIMCATSRMVVKRKGADKPVVLACTLLPYDEEFELSETLKGSLKRIQLNHRFCSEFCVTGGGACSVSD